MSKPVRTTGLMGRAVAASIAVVAIGIGTAGSALASDAADMTQAEAPPALTPEQMSAAPNASWYAVSAGGDILTSEDDLVDLAPPAPAPDGQVSPYLINDPFAWAACFVNYDEDYPLAAYAWTTSAGNPMNIQLQCGYHTSSTGAGHGWHHISVQHEQQWRNRIIQVGGSADGAGWDDLMSWANLETISWPYYYAGQISSKVCVSSATMMYDNDGDYVYTFWPTVIFSEDSKRVITSIPSSSSRC